MIGKHREYDAIEMGASALPAFNPFQYILPLPVADDGNNACGISIPVNVPSDVGNDNDEEFYDWEYYK